MFAITAFFVFAVFFASEFYRFRRRIRGEIVEIRPVDGDPAALMGAHIRVCINHNLEVAAFVSGCQLCANSLEIGDAVCLVPGPDGYVIKPHWTSKRRRGVCLKGMTP
jgi:hypothetical protein